MFERYTDRARRVIFFARYEASQLGCDHVEAEHLLLALIREDKSLFDRLLPGAKGPQLVENEIRRQAHTSAPSSTSIDLPVSHSMRRALASAAEVAERLQHQQVKPAHLLFGLLIEPSIASVVLGRHGLDQARVSEELAALAMRPTAPTRPPSNLKSQFAELASRLKPDVEPATVFLLERNREAD